VNPETLQAYEVGSKSDLLGGRARLNSSFYLYSYKDLQVTAYEIGPGSSTAGAFLQNAAAARIYGMDFSGALKISDELTFGLNGGYLHARFTSFPAFAGYLPAAVGNAAATLNTTGNAIQRSPTFTSSATLDYAHSFSHGDKLETNLSLNHNSGYYFDASDLYKQKAYEILNAVISYTMPPGRLTISLWGTNLTNTFYENAELVYAFGTIVQDAPPRMYGLKLAYNFGR